MGIFSKPKKKEELVLVFDVGSSSVGGALFFARESGIPKIIFSIREKIVPENELNSERLLSQTVKSLEMVASKISKASLGVPKKTFCVLSSPWYASQTRTIKIEKNNPFIFTQKLADSLIKKEINLFKREHGIDNEHSNGKNRPIELKNIKTVLDGETESDPLNKKIKKLEMNIFISMSPEDVLKKIEHAIGKYFYFGNIKFSSFALASFTVSRDVFMHHEDFLLMDIGGEITDISIVTENILRDSISFPLGRNFLVREASNLFNCSLDDAKTLVSLYKDKHMEKSIEKKFGPIMNDLKSKWLEKFQESLSVLFDDTFFPSTIFLTSDQDISAFFSEMIKNTMALQSSSGRSKFNVISLNTKELHGIVLFRENVTRDPFIIIESVYINRFFV
ncbi:hypothetical protein KKB58_00325 [Patescibacteria group bacterium]|nr:hypothetical protein [Patescibacteria group bacterium]